jgi:hypothetical protein
VRRIAMARCILLPVLLSALSFGLTVKGDPASPAAAGRQETIDLGNVDQAAPTDDEMDKFLEKLLAGATAPKGDVGIQKVGQTVGVKGVLQKNAKGVAIMYTRLSNPNWRGIWHWQDDPIKRDGDKFEADFKLIDQNGTPSEGAGEFFVIVAVQRNTDTKQVAVNLVGLQGHFKAISKLVVVKRDK